MPIRKPNPDEILPTDFAAQRLDTEEGPGVWETTKAAFKTENIVGSTIEALDHENGFDRLMSTLSRDTDPTYNPYHEADIDTFTDEEQLYLADAKSNKDYVYLKDRLQREKENRQILLDAGGTGIATSMVAGIVDPTLLISGAGFLKGAKLATSMSRGQRFVEGAKTLAPLTAVEVGTQEAILQGTQLTRTAEESAIAVGGGVLLASVLGGAAAAIPSTKFAEISKAVDDHIAPEKLPPEPEARAVGAAGVSKETREAHLKAEAEQWKALEILPKPLSRLIDKIPFSGPDWKFNAVSRLTTSPVKASRTLVHRLTEVASYLKGDVEGIGRPDMALSTALEDLFDTDALVLNEVKRLHKKMSARIKKEGGTSMNFEQFRAQVAHAHRRHNMHDIPEVSAAARHVNEKVYAPLRDEAVKQGKFAEDLKLRKGESYSPRYYNVELLKGRGAAGFKNLLTRHLEKILPDEALDDLEEIVNSIYDKITHAPAGRANINLGEMVPKAKAFKDRMLDIPVDDLEPYLINDIGEINRRYVRDVGFELESGKRGLSRDLLDEMEEINTDYQVLKDEALREGDHKLHEKLIKQHQKDIDAVMQIRDEMLGTYGADMGKMEVLRAWNYMSMLGGMTVSALADVALPIVQFGLKPYAKTLFKLATSAELRRAAKADLAKMKVALEVANMRRAMAMGGYHSMGDALNSVTEKFTYATLVNQWTGLMKNVAGTMAEDVVLKNMDDYAAGKLSKSMTMKLSRAGISKDITAPKIIEQFKKHGETVDGMRIANIDKWDDPDAAMLFRAAIKKQVDLTINSPKPGLLPSWMHSYMGKLFGQFKSFLVLSHGQAFIPSMQNLDLSVVMGMTMSVMVGMQISRLKQAITGYKREDDAESLLMAGIEEVGPLTLTMEVNNILDSFGYGANSLLGASQSIRNQARDKDPLKILLGASATTVIRATDVLKDFAPGNEVDAGTVHNIRKLAFYNNLFYARSAFDALQQATEETFDLAKPRSPLTRSAEGWEEYWEYLQGKGD